jgi:uncharacterized membrane protein YdjX (TVP38/TMEM64 family)
VVKRRISIRNILSLIGFPSLFIAMFLIIFLNLDGLTFIFGNQEELKTWINSQGVAAPLVFICLQILQVVVFIIPGEIPQIAGGYLFGMALGTLYSVTGILIGSAINFYLARFLGIPFVKALFSREKLEKTQQLAASPQSQIIFFILFLIPGLPKDLFTYVAGLSPISFFTFLIISGAGRLPGIIGSTLIGEAASQKNWILVTAISIIAVILFFTGYFYREKIFGLIRHFFSKKKNISDK